MELSKKLKSLRGRRKLTVKEMAYGLDIPESTYRGYEYGSKLPADLLPKICGILSVSFDEFFREGKASDSPEDQAEQLLYLMENCLKDLRSHIELTKPNK